MEEISLLLNDRLNTLLKSAAGAWLDKQPWSKYGTAAYDGKRRAVVNDFRKQCLRRFRTGAALPVTPTANQQAAGMTVDDVMQLREAFLDAMRAYLTQVDDELNVLTGMYDPANVRTSAKSSALASAAGL